jgi:hypothetical protein
MVNAMEKVKEFYYNRLEQLEVEASRLKKKSRYILISRLVSFLMILGCFYIFGITVTSALIAFGFLMVFLKLVAISVDQKKRIKFNTSLIQINQAELNALDGKWSFDSGKEFESSMHAFSSDLDLFEEKGVFSFLNRTSTLKAKKAFADLLLNGNKNVEKFHQQTNGLIEEMTWTQEFRAFGDSEDAESDWVNGTASIDVNIWNKLEVVILPLICSALIILSVVGMISIQVIFYFTSIFIILLICVKLKFSYVENLFIILL